MQLIRGDCLELLGTIEGSSVDMVLCDLPFGTSGNEWDNPLPLAPLWTEWGRVCKESAIHKRARPEQPEGLPLQMDMGQDEGLQLCQREDHAYEVS